MPKRFLQSLAAGFLLSLPQFAAAQVTPAFNDVSFAVVPLDGGGTQSLPMDIFIPTGPGGPWPLVVWIHGGGWSGGSYNSPPPGIATLLSRGIAAASVEYRLSGVAIFTAQIHDVKGAVRFLRANAATFNIDPNRFASWGSSAGGHLSALLGTSGGVAAAEGSSGGNLAFSSRVQACVDWFGPTDILNMNLDVTTPPGSTIDHDAPSSPESNLIGFDGPAEGIGVLRANQSNPAPPFPEKMALVNLANPITHVSVDDPPFLIVHGTADTLVPFAQSQKLFDALDALDHEVTLTPVVGAGHGGFPASTTNATIDFIAAHLGAAVPGASGDMTCNGGTNGRDIQPFLIALFNPVAYANIFPACNILNGDFDGNGQVTTADIPGFAARLVQ